VSHSTSKEYPDIVISDEIERFELRRSDYSLDEEHQALGDAFRMFLEKHCPAERVRQAEPVGWDEALWSALADLRPVAMGVRVARGGDGAGLLDLTVVCEEAGRRAVPVPLVEAVVAARLLGECEPTALVSATLEAILEGTIVSIAVGSTADRSGRRLVPAGAIARSVLALQEQDLVLAGADPRPPHLPNLASAPLAWWDLAGAEVLVRGAGAQILFDRAEQEWRVLTSAMLVGAGQTALDLAVEYAKEREAFGQAIGAYQAIAHPLVDVAIGIESARRLTHKAAWFLDHEPDAVGPLVSMAFVHAAESAERAGSIGVHTQGGFGYTLESDVQLYFRRAKGWALVAGDRRQELRRAADLMFGHDIGVPA
jgi:alkylation response protein AidB-like acyl-CoA dehydrogenase